MLFSTRCFQLFTPLFVLILFFSCREDDAGQLPYEPIAKQRANLASKQRVKSIRILDSSLLARVLFSLSSDSLEGRAPGTRGHSLANSEIALEMRKMGLDSIGGSVFQNFVGDKINGSTEGKNIIGLVKGKAVPDQYIIITAHYDHLGKSPENVVFPGADDNASGVAGLLALARYFNTHPHNYSLLFVALDKEETGLQGAIKLIPFLKSQGLLEKMQLNINLDMIARSDKDELFACGVRHYPRLKYLVDDVQELVNVKLLMGHDDPDAGEDWTQQSDHYVFHELGIPFLYLGVEDHADYHKPSDRPEKIDMSRFVENCNAIAAILLQFK